MLDVERVDWTPAQHGTLTVRVHGRWRAGSPPGGPIVLLVFEAGARRRFDALDADDGAPAGGGWSAAFAVPGQLRSALAEGLALEAGGSEHALPGARPRAADALEPGTGEEGEVVDRAVLAERRARRAELVEDALTRRATQAEQAVGALEEHLGGLEQRLGEVAAARDELRERLAERERALEAARAGGAEADGLRAELEDARAGAAAEMERLRADLEVARAGAAESEALRADLEDARTTLAGEQARAVAAEARAAAEEERAVVLEARVAELEEHAAGLEHELAEAVEQLKAGREELGSAEAAAADRYAAAQAIAAARHRAAELENRLAAVEAERLAPPPASPPPVWAPAPPAPEGGDALTDARRVVQTIGTDLGGLRARLTEDDETAAERAGAQSDLREGLDRLAGELRDDFASDRERQQRELREVVDHVRGLREEFAATMAQVRAQLAPRHPAGEEVHTSASLSALGEALDRERTEAPTPPDERLVAGLGEAADRLRAETPPVEETEHESQAPAAAPEPAPAEGAPFPARVVALEDRVENDWLARSIASLAGDQPRRAGQLLVALLPSQRLTARRALTYDLTVPEAGAFRVHLDRGQAQVERRTRPATATEEVALRIAGPAAALAPLAAGGARRRLRGARVEGSRWTLRRLLRTRRDPVSLAALARAGDRLDAGLLLTALARAVDPAWAQGTELSVAYHLTPGARAEGDAAAGSETAEPPAAPGPQSDATWIVTATGEGPLRVHPDPPPRAWTSAPEAASADIASAPAPVPSPAPEAGPEPTAGAPARKATVHVPAPALTNLLAREELPGAAAATVEGDVDAVALLHAWFDRVQGLPVAD